MGIAISAPTPDHKAAWSFDTSYNVGGRLRLTFGRVVNPKQTRGFLFGSGDGELVAGEALVSGATLFRLGPDGDLKSTTTIRDAVDETGQPHDRTNGLDGMPVAIDTSGDTWVTCCYSGLSRFLTNGTRDTAFGLQTLGPEFPRRRRLPLVVTAEPAGGVLVGSAREYREGKYDQGRVQRVMPSGEVDHGFGVDGTLNPGFVPTCMVALPDGRILLGTKNGLVAFTGTGTPDADFGEDGRVTLPGSGEKWAIGRASPSSCVLLPNGSVDVIQSKGAGRWPSASRISQIDSTGRVTHTSSRLDGEPTSVTVFADSGVAVDEERGLGVLTGTGTGEGDGWVAHIEAFDESLRRQHRFAGSDRVTVSNTLHNVNGQTLVLPTGDLLAVVESTHRSLDLARIRLGRRTPPSGTPPRTGDPAIRIGKVDVFGAAYGGAPKTYGALPIAQVSYRCPQECQLGTLSWRYERLGKRPRTVFVSDPTIVTAARPFRLHVSTDPPFGNPRNDLFGGRYRLTVTATDAYGRTASARRTFTVRCHREGGYRRCGQ
ncbi:MAG: hypothetical protein HZB46_04215 [Solirubrobacterales bacterium]|nr:hypothetical protein [Solirubrobacterales bacterium]